MYVLDHETGNPLIALKFELLVYKKNYPVKVHVELNKQN